MRTPEIDRLLADANPVTTPPPGRVTPAQERILAGIVAGEAPPRRRRGRAVVRTLAVATVGLAAVIAGVYVAARDAGSGDEVEVTAPGAQAGPGLVQKLGPPTSLTLIHAVTRMYGTSYGPGKGERRDGWLEPATGRARIVVTTGAETTLQQEVGADDRVRSWQGALGNAGGIRQDERSPDLAADLRALVEDPIGSLVRSARTGFRQDGATLGRETVTAGEYKGRAVVVHRIAPTVDGRPTGYFFRWYMEPGNGGEPLAFERGTVDAAGREVVQEAEELVAHELFSGGNPALPEDPLLEELDWVEPPPRSAEPPENVAPAVTPTPSPALRTPTPTPTPASPGR